MEKLIFLFVFILPASGFYNSQSNNNGFGPALQRPSMNFPSSNNQRNNIPRNNQRNNQANNDIPILRDERLHPLPDGTYSFAFETGDGITREESAVPNQGNALSVEGSYSYTAPDGTFVEMKYTADENGFRVESPLVPPTAANNLEEYRKSQMFTVRPEEMNYGPPLPSQYQNIMTYDLPSPHQNYQAPQQGYAYEEPQIGYDYEEPQQIYHAPQQSYEAPQQIYQIPQQQYQAPQQGYRIPQQQYQAPQQHYQPPQQVYKAPLIRKKYSVPKAKNMYEQPRNNYQAPPPQNYQVPISSYASAPTGQINQNNRNQQSGSNFGQQNFRNQPNQGRQFNQQNIRNQLNRFNQITSFGSQQNRGNQQNQFRPQNRNNNRQNQQFNQSPSISNNPQIQSLINQRQQITQPELPIQTNLIIQNIPDQNRQNFDQSQLLFSPSSIAIHQVPSNIIIEEEYSVMKNNLPIVHLPETVIPVKTIEGIPVIELTETFD